MKLMRKILALSLAVMLVMSLMLNVSAAYDWMEYGGEQYYFTLNCEAYEAYGKTETSSLTALVGVYVAMYDGTVCIATGSCENARLSAACTVTSSRAATDACSKHYADGATIYTASAYAN